MVAPGSKGVFAAGVVAGSALAAAAALLLLPDGPQQQTGTAQVPGAVPAASPAAGGQQPAAVTASLPTAPSPCAFQPLLPSSADNDGQFLVEPALATSGDARPAAFVTVSREAASEGRQRDAEVALIVACRLEGRLSPSPSVPVANIMSLLGQHYVAAAAREPAQGPRGELLARARELLDGSVQGYSAVLGAGAARTQQASQQLAAVTRSEQPAAVPLPALQEERESEALAGGCAGRSVPCDAELQQLDSDLRRLRAQAESVSTDRSGLRRRAAQAQARLDACHDRGCLLRWYAQRRGELLAEF